MKRTETLKERMLLRVELGEIYEENLKLMESKGADLAEIFLLRNSVTAFLKWFTVNEKKLKKIAVTPAPIEWVEDKSYTPFRKKGD